MENLKLDLLTERDRLQTENNDLKTIIKEVFIIIKNHREIDNNAFYPTDYNKGCKIEQDLIELFLKSLLKTFNITL